MLHEISQSEHDVELEGSSGSRADEPGVWQHRPESNFSLFRREVEIKVPFIWKRACPDE